MTSHCLAMSLVVAAAGCWGNPKIEGGSAGPMVPGGEDSSPQVHIEGRLIITEKDLLKKFDAEADRITRRSARVRL